MGKVISITGGEQPAAALTPNQDVITTLEEMLEKAKAGIIQHLVAVFSDGTHVGDLYQGSGEPWHVAALIGGMELCKFTMLNSLSLEDSAAQA